MRTSRDRPAAERIGKLLAATVETIDPNPKRKRGNQLRPSLTRRVTIRFDRVTYKSAASRQSAFTLVELLVVISIIGILLAVLLPAVQAARENARLTQCKSNLKQLGLAFLNHEQAHRYLPTGGWGWKWMADPDRGFGRSQPGGWPYAILPYLEQSSLRKRGWGQPDAIKRAEVKAVAETPQPLFVCPSRAIGPTYAFVNPTNFCNIDRPAQVARTDYAANVGDGLPTLYGAGPRTLQEGDAARYAWTQLDRTGVVFRRSQIALAHIRDGTSHTYLVGEAYLNPDYYASGVADNNDQGMYVGYDRDTLRCTHPSHPPLRDTPGANHDHSFGSVHAETFLMVLGDGSVRAVAFTVSIEIHRRLGNRRDGLPVTL